MTRNEAEEKLLALARISQHLSDAIASFASDLSNSIPTPAPLPRHNPPEPLVHIADKPPALPADTGECTPDEHTQRILDAVAPLWRQVHRIDTSLNQLTRMTSERATTTAVEAHTMALRDLALHQEQLQDLARQLAHHINNHLVPTPTKDPHP